MGEYFDSIELDDACLQICETSPIPSVTEPVPEESSALRQNSEDVSDNIEWEIILGWKPLMAVFLMRVQYNVPIRLRLILLAISLVSGEQFTFDAFH